LQFSLTIALAGESHGVAARSVNIGDISESP
jgi:hypothetical protein